MSFEMLYMIDWHAELEASVFAASIGFGCFDMTRKRRSLGKDHE